MTLTNFLRGGTAIGCAAAALIFLRFYRQSFDRSFLFFSLAFELILAAIAENNRG